MRVFIFICRCNSQKKKWSNED